MVGLHIEGLRALRRVDWPADGMGWDGAVPDMVMVGGVNGSGKTTLLELIADTMGMVSSGLPAPRSDSANYWVDIQLRSALRGEASCRVVVGDEARVAAARTTESIAFCRSPSGWRADIIGSSPGVLDLLKSGSRHTDLPGVVYFPSDRRLAIPEESFKSAGQLEDDAVGFVHRYSPATKWKESLEALLYAARWADLNAKEEGHPERAVHFESYARAFQAFFGDAKRLIWKED